MNRTRKAKLLSDMSESRCSQSATKPVCVMGESFLPFIDYPCFCEQTNATVQREIYFHDRTCAEIYGKSTKSQVLSVLQDIRNIGPAEKDRIGSVLVSLQSNISHVCQLPNGNCNAFTTVDFMDFLNQGNCSWASDNHFISNWLRRIAPMNASYVSLLGSAKEKLHVLLTASKWNPSIYTHLTWPDFSECVLYIANDATGRNYTEDLKRLQKELGEDLIWSSNVAEATTLKVDQHKIDRLEKSMSMNETLPNKDNAIEFLNTARESFPYYTLADFTDVTQQGHPNGEERLFSSHLVVALVTTISLLINFGMLY